MITAMPSHAAPADQVHGNSMHGKVRAVLDRGLDAEWSSKEVAGLLGLDLRGAQYLMCNPELLKSFGHPTKSERSLRRTTGLSLLIYILKHSDEITAEDALPITKKVLPLLTDAHLEGVVAAAKAIIQKRRTVIVAVKPAAAAAPTAAPQKQASTAPAELHTEFPFVADLTAPATG